MIIYKIQYLLMMKYKIFKNNVKTMNNNLQMM